MAGRLIPAVQATVTAATAGGYATVSSATGLYVGGRGWLSKTDHSLSIPVEITEINGTSIGLRQILDRGLGINYGRTDISAYNAGGFLNQDQGLVYNRNDAAAP